MRRKRVADVAFSLETVCSKTERLPGKGKKERIPSGCRKGESLPAASMRSIL
jgi:hypothetical protein